MFTQIGEGGIRKDKLTSASLNKHSPFCFEFIMSEQLRSMRIAVKVHNEDNRIKENKEGGLGQMGWTE